MNGNNYSPKKNEKEKHKTQENFATIEYFVVERGKYRESKHKSTKKKHKTKRKKIKTKEHHLRFSHNIGDSLKAKRPAKEDLITGRECSAE